MDSDHLFGIFKLFLHIKRISGYSSRYEAELAVFVEYFSSSSGTNMGSKYYLSHAVFSETV
jgi:hypothetical protein